MQRIFLKFILLSLFCISFTLKAYPADTYKIDPMHSVVEWHISHFGFSHPSGKWLIEGTLLLDQEKPANSQVSVTIPIANMITGIPKLDEHLKSAEFFDVAKYPTATFVSKKITVTGKDKANVSGILTLHGVSKPVTLKVELNKLATNPISEKMTAGFTGNTTLKRSDFGMTSFIPGLGDEVIIHIEVEANKVN